MATKIGRHLADWENSRWLRRFDEEALGGVIKAHQFMEHLELEAEEWDDYNHYVLLRQHLLEVAELIKQRRDQ